MASNAIFRSNRNAITKDPSLGRVFRKRHGRGTFLGTKRRILPYNPILKQRAKELRAHMTLAEVLLWNHLKNWQIYGFDFDRQRPIDNYIVDFYCKDLMLAIEVDGSCHYTDEAKTNDRIRQNRLESFGVRFLRFDNSDVEKNIDVVVRSISEWVDKHRNELVGRY